MKTCSICSDEKSDELFRKNRSQCLACHHNYLKEYRAQNKEGLKNKRVVYSKLYPEKITASNRKNYETHKDACGEYRKGYYANHQDELIEYAKEYREDNKDALSEKKRRYYQDNRTAIIAKKAVYQNVRYNNDPFYRLRSLVSRAVYRMIRSSGSSKNGGSIVDHLPYSFQELKDHLEKQFEPWMTWNNQGRYDPKIWDDNDPMTWTWQIDHIVPQTDTPYSSMDEESFKLCWALSNLRPYSAQQNLLDGSKRIRHK